MPGVALLSRQPPLSLFFFQAEDGIRDLVRSRGLGDVYKRQNTIRLSIYSRRDEIELMLLIGATPSFVKVPYLFEGMLQGLTGSILALFLIKGIIFYLKDEFQSTIESISMEFQFIAEPYLFGLVGLSLLVGLVASYLSTYQFLRIYK